MAIANLFEGPPPTATYYLRVPGRFTPEQLLSAIAPLMESYDRVGSEVAETPVTWVAKADPSGSGDGGYELYWEVTSPRTLAGLQTARFTFVPDERPGHRLSDEFARFEASTVLPGEIARVRPPSVFTSYKVNLKQKVPGDPAAVRLVAYNALRDQRLRQRIGADAEKFTLWGEPIPGDRGEVPTPAVARRVPVWMIAGGVLALAGTVAYAVQRKKR